MSYNPQQKRDLHGRWTKEGLRDAIKNKIKGKIRFLDPTGKVRGVTDVEHFNPQNHGLGLKEKLKEKIKAEISGKQLKQKTHEEIFNDFHQAGENLLKKLNIPRQPSVVDMQKVLDTVKDSSGISDSQRRKIEAHYRTHGAQSSALPQIKSGLLMAHKLIGDAKIPTLDEVRDYAGDGSEERAGASWVLKGIHIGKKTSPTTMLHEIGHHLEFSDSNIRMATAHFLQKRTDGNVYPLNSLVSKKQATYGAGEEAYKDKFIHPYVGKVYADGTTEVLSMGFEHFTKQADMVDFYNKDPEHFKLTLGIILHRQKHNGDEK